MASSYDFFIAGDHTAGRGIVDQVLIAQGFALSITPEGNIVAERGKKGMSIAFGALAGSSFHISFLVEYFVDAQGQLVARLRRNMAAGALKGGVLGANKVENVFVGVVDALTNSLTEAGVLANRVEN